MAAKDADGPAPVLDFSSPRVLAAMRVTGIKESDLSQPPPPIHWTSPTLRGARSARGAIADKTPVDDKAGSLTSRPGMSPKEMWERKQLALLRELEATADALDETDVDNILSQDGPQVDEAEAELSKKKVTVDRMRERVRKQLQREAQREIQRVTATAAAASNREAVARRLEEQRKELLETQKAQADKRAAQHAKVQEKVKAGLKELRRKREETQTKLTENDERISKLIAERTAGGDPEFRERYQKRFARIAEWRMNKEDDELREKAEKWERTRQHHDDVAERLQKARDEEKARLEERKEKFSGMMDKVAETQATEEREREKKFLDHAKKMQDARDIAKGNEKEKLATMQEKRTKQLTKWTTNRQSIVKEKRQKIKELREKLDEMPAKAEEARGKHLEETMGPKMLTRGMIAEIVDQNKARISRGDDQMRKQTLAKIERANAKVESVHEQKRQVEAMRTQVIKESMHDKMRVEELRRLDPSTTEASTRRVNDILSRLDLPTLKTKGVKEGEEGQQQ